MIADRFGLMVHILAGYPRPGLPRRHPGQVTRHQLQDEPDDLELPPNLPASLTRERALVLIGDGTDAAVAELIGVTRQRVNQLRRVLRQAMQAARATTTTTT